MLLLGALVWAQAPGAAGAEAAAIKTLVGAYNDPAGTATAFDAALDNFRAQFPHSKQMLAALALGVRYHRARSEYLPELRYGVAALAIDPQDLYVLSSLGMAIPDNVKNTDLDRDQQLDRAAGFDRQVIAAASTWLIGATGLDYGGRHYTEAQAQAMRNNLEGAAFLSLGRVASLREQPADAVAAYQRALAFETVPDRQAQLYYDIGAAEVLQNHPPEARAALAKARQLAPNADLLMKLVQTEEAKLPPASGGGL